MCLVVDVRAVLVLRAQRKFFLNFAATQWVRNGQSGSAPVHCAAETVNVWVGGVASDGVTADGRCVPELIVVEGAVVVVW